MPEELFRCPRCGSNRFVSVSYDRGYTRLPQCVPCGQVHPDYFGHGSQSPKRDSGWTKREPTP
jgi:uncharacterized Zn finger protein